MNTDSSFSLGFVNAHIGSLLQAVPWQEKQSADGGPYLPLTRADAPEQSAGFLRLWLPALANSTVDRMVHLCLLAGRAETQLLFVFGRDSLSVPHLHLQVVQFPPDGCVYNVDLLPRLDPVYEPGWFDRVFGPLRRPYRQATASGEYSCAQAPANPALAMYMSPWGIASGRTTVSELEQLSPQIDAYVSHYCQLIQQDGWEAPPGVDLRDRDARHMQIFFDDELDPRAWNGVYGIVGEARGRMIKSFFQKPQSA